MRLIFAVVQGKDADNLRSALLDNGYRTTQINSAGGFLRETNATFLVGVDDSQVEDVLRIVKQTCYTRTQFVNPLLPIMEPGEFYMPSPVEVQVGGAAVFVCKVARYERIFPSPASTSAVAR